MNEIINEPDHRVLRHGSRILSIDVLRGFGIMVILVIHRIHYHWTGMRTSESLREHFSGIWAPLIIFTIALFTMAGIFYFISGIVNAYAMYTRVSNGKSNARKAMIGGITSGLWIFLMNYVQRIFFMNGFLPGEGGDDSKFPVGLATGFIRDPSVNSFSWIQVTEPGTLSLIGLNIVFVSLLLGFLLRKTASLENSKLYTWLVVAAFFFLVLSPLSKYFLRPVYEHFLATGGYFQAICVGHLCQEFGLLPYLGYGFIGAIIGLGLAKHEDKVSFNRRNNIIALVSIITGLLMIILFDRKETFGRGCIGSGICMIELGLFVIIFRWLLNVFDRCTREKYEKRKLRSIGVRRFGMMALTVYILEPFIAEILKTLVDQVAGTGWNDHLPNVLIFGFGCLIFWYFALKIWENARYKGSLEWLTVIILQKLAGKKSGKASFENM